ncbi:MAG: AAA family ATPase [Myxococcales bacterium]|nr:AAA family ATPase [Myxococcales bacterium]
MTPALHDQILERLLADESIDSRAVTLVDAACQGAAKLDEALAKLGSAETSAKGDGPRQGKKVPVGAYLKRLELGGFRGIGPAVALEFQPGPGLTLLLGRNGSGKSSFAEGLETLLTAESRRWAERPKDWQRGWKNFHTDAGSFVEATFFVEGSEPIVLRRSWKADAALENGELRVRTGSERLDAGLAALGWVEPLITFRPFLSHSELGALLTEPSRLHDELKSILGLEEITVATSLLAEAKKTRERQRKDVTERLKGLSEQLAAIDDPRAVGVATPSPAGSGRSTRSRALSSGMVRPRRKTA